MRINPTVVNVSLVALLPACLAIFALRVKFARTYAVTLATVTALDLVINILGLGPLAWWSPIHWPSTLALGFDEIVENHGVLLSTVGYLLDLMAWSAAIATGITIWKARSASATSSTVAPPPA